MKVSRFITIDEARKINFLEKEDLVIIDSFGDRVSKSEYEDILKKDESVSEYSFFLLENISKNSRLNKMNKNYSLMIVKFSFSFLLSFILMILSFVNDDNRIFSEALFFLSFVLMISSFIYNEKSKRIKKIINKIEK